MGLITCSITRWTAPEPAGGVGPAPRLAVCDPDLSDPGRKPRATFDCGPVVRPEDDLTYGFMQQKSPLSSQIGRDRQVPRRPEQRPAR